MFTHDYENPINNIPLTPEEEKMLSRIEKKLKKKSLLLKKKAETLIKDKPMETLNEKLSTSIRMMRLSKKMKQSDMAEKLGVSIPSYSRIETGKVELNVNTLESISKILDIEINFNSVLKVGISFQEKQSKKGDDIYPTYGRFPTHPATKVVTIKDNIQGDWWYIREGKKQFTVRECKNRGELRGIANTGGYDCSDLYIIDNGLEMGFAILKSHCEPTKIKSNPKKSKK